MLNRRLTRAAAAVAAASVIGVWSPQLGYELGLSSSNRAQAAPWVTPSGVKVDEGNKSLFVYWAANTDNLTGYRVSASYTPFLGTPVVKTVNVSATATSALLTELDNGRTYSITVTAVYADGVSGNATASGTPTTTYLPSQLTNISSGPPQDSKVTLTWTLPTDTNRKRIDVYRDGALRASLAATDTIFSESGVTNYTAYQYQVFSVNTNTLLGLTNFVRSDPATLSVTPVDLTPPAVPSTLTATPTDKAVGLSWAANGESDFASYTVTLPSGANVTTSTPSYTATGLTNGTNYTFKVSAVDTHGNPSAQATVTAKPVDNVAPDIPAGLTVSPADSALTVGWTRSAAADTAGYKIFLDGVYKTTIPAGTTSLSLTGLTNGTSYRVQVSAVDGVPNESLRSGSVYGTPADLTAPSAPTGFVGTAGDGTATFSWNASPETDVDRYVVRNSSGTTVAAVGAGATTASVTGLTNGTTGTYSVVAIDKAGNISPASNVVSVTPRDMTPPSAPTNLTGTAGDTRASLSWTASPESDVHHYLVRSASGVTLLSVPVGTTTAALTGLANDNAVTFSVVAVDATGNVSTASNSISLTPRDTTPPSAPTNLSGTAGDSKVSLAWNASLESDVHHYDVRNLAGATVATVAVGTTTATISGLTNDVAVKYTVVAVDRAGNISSASNQVTITPKDTTPPSAPTNLTANAGDKTAVLNWTASPEADTDKYFVRDMNGTTVATVAAGTTTATITGLTNDVAVKFTVVAVDRSGNVSGASNQVTVTPKDTTAPSAPVNLVGVAGDRRVTLTWTGSPEADTDQYLVRDVNGATLATLGAGSTSTTLTGLTNDVAVKFTVVAVDRSGNVSGASNQVTVTPKDTTPPAAATGVLSSAGNTTVTVTWAAGTDPDVDHYEIVDQSGTRANAPAGSTSSTVSGLTNGTSYSFSVVAVDAAGNRSAPSAAPAATPRAPIAAPTGVTATAGDASATIAWTAVNDTRVDHYSVCTSAPSCVSVPVGTTTYTATGLTNGTTYTYTVVAVDTAGAASAASLPASATPQAVAPATPPAPPAPLNLSGTGSDGAVVLSWSSVAGATDYDVLVNGAVVRRVSGTSASVSALSNGTEYTFTVRAVGVGGTSADSAAVKVTPRAALSATTPSAGVGGSSGFTSSRDGRFSIFGTAAQLEASDTNTAYELYVRDDSTGSLTRLDPSAVGTDLNSSGVAISDDGRFAYATTSAAKVPADVNGLADVYRLDRQSGTWQLVSVPASGATSSVAGTVLQKENRTYAAGPSVATTADGNYVFFFSARADLVAGDTNNAVDLFRKDMSTGEVFRVSAGAGGSQLSAGATGPALDVTPDGRYVAFVSTYQSVPVLWRKDLTSGALDVVSGIGSATSLSYAFAVTSDSGDVSISDDGRYASFSSNNTRLTAGASEYLGYRRDMNTAGAFVRAGISSQKASWERGVQLDPTGRYAFVATAVNYGTDTNNRVDWYRQDLGTTGSTPVLVTALSNGGAAALSGAVTMPEYGFLSILSGDQVLVNTMLPLVTLDTNKKLDLYRKVISTGAVGSAV